MNTRALAMTLRDLAASLEQSGQDELADYPRLCVTCGGTGHIVPHAREYGDYDTTCPDCDGHGERAATFEVPT